MSPRGVESAAGRSIPGKGKAAPATAAAAVQDSGGPAARPAWLGLQAAAGNAAVSSVLQRVPVVQRQPVTNDAEFQAAVARNDLPAAVAYLAGLSTPAAMAKPVKLLGLGAVESLLPHVSATQHAVRGTLLERGFELAKGTDWGKAARFVIVLDDPGIVRNIAPLGPAELRQLAKGARNSPGGGHERLLGPIRAALKAKPGELFGTVAVKMQEHHGVYRRWDADDAYKCRVEIVFTPDPTVVDASLIAFVQTMSLLETEPLGRGKYASKEDRSGLDDRFNAKKQAVDRPPRAGSGWYGQGSDPKASTLKPESGVDPGFATGGTVHPATMVDTPEGKYGGTTWSYETSVIAREGTDTGLTYAVVTWSFVVDNKLQIVAKNHAVVDKPTADFGAAVSAWNRQAAGSGGKQQPLPAQRSVDPAAAPPP